MVANKQTNKHVKQRLWKCKNTEKKLNRKTCETRSKANN